MPDPTPLEMIYNQLKTMEQAISERDKRFDDKLDKIITCQIDLKLQDEIIKAKVSAIELQQLQLQEELTKHKKDTQQHYNPYYNETLPQKMWRKKPEIAAGGGLGALIVAIITWLLQNYNG